MALFSQKVLRRLRQNTVIFTIGKSNGAFGWGSGFACFPSGRAILTCGHNFVDAVPHTVIARHAFSDERFTVPHVVFSKNLDCAIAILDKPITAGSARWAESLKEGEPVAVHDYIQGIPGQRVDIALKGALSDNHLEGISTSEIVKGEVWVGSQDRRRDTRVFGLPGSHPGLSGSAIINQAGELIGQVGGSMDSNVHDLRTVTSHLLEELRLDADEMYSEAQSQGYV